MKFIEKEANVIPVSEPIDVVTHDQPTAIKTENNYKVGSTPVPVYTPPSKPPHRQIPKTDQGKLNQRVHQDGVYYFYIGDNRQDAPSNNWVNKNVQENLSDLSEPISLEDKNFSSINHAVLFTELPTVMPENMDNAVLMNKSVKFKVLETFPIDDQHFKYRSHVWAKIKIIEG